MLLTGLCFACNPSEPIAQSAVGNTNLAANFKGDGTAFYTVDARSGQLSYMLDYGEEAGAWKRFGNPYRKGANGGLYLDASERLGNGTSFYLLDKSTGQLNYMLDYGPGAGTWTSFGNPIGTKNVSDFEANLSAAGTIFYAYDGIAKKLYFMRDFGEQAGQWIQYGEDKN